MSEDGSAIPLDMMELHYALDMGEGARGVVITNGSASGSELKRLVLAEHSSYYVDVAPSSPECMAFLGQTVAIADDKSLAEQGLNDGAMINLTVDWEAVTAGQRRRAVERHLEKTGQGPYGGAFHPGEEGWGELPGFNCCCFFSFPFEFFIQTFLPIATCVCIPTGAFVAFVITCRCCEEKVSDEEKRKCEEWMEYPNDCVESDCCTGCRRMYHCVCFDFCCSPTSNVGISSLRHHEKVHCCGCGRHACGGSMSDAGLYRCIVFMNPPARRIKACKPRCYWGCNDCCCDDSR